MENRCKKYLKTRFWYKCVTTLNNNNRTSKVKNPNNTKSKIFDSNFQLISIYLKDKDIDIVIN